jgi:hypothetical protein
VKRKKTSMLRIKKKNLIGALMLIILLIFSIKPLLFTYNYFLSKYYLYVLEDSKKSEAYTLEAIRFNPKSYKYVGAGNKLDNLIKVAIHYENIGVYNELTNDKKKKTEEKYRDNFYFQNILNNLDKKREWQHLDEVSYFFLRDKKYNKLTISILDKLNPEFDKEFLNNILDFLKWQDNIELFNYIKKKHKLNNYEYIKPENAIKYKDSILKIKDILFKELSIKKELIGNNLIGAPDFEDEKKYKKYWSFANHSNGKPFGKGSFFVGIERVEKNRMIRDINLYIDNSLVKDPARGGIWYKEGITVYKGFYVLSFDYWTKTGKGKPGFWLQYGINIPWLPCFKQKWKKVVYILNNVNGEIKKLKPLIRMFGKGSMYTDNVYLGKLDVKVLDFKGRFYFKVIDL